MSATIYTIGYKHINVTDLEFVVRAGDLMMFDTRINPYSPNPTWAKESLMKRFGHQYYHLRQLGNELYKEGGVKIVDLPFGISVLSMYLTDGISVVLLCTCPDVATCHRNVISAALHEATHCPVIHWTAETLRGQMELWG